MRDGDIEKKNIEDIENRVNKTLNILRKKIVDFAKKEIDEAKTRVRDAKGYNAIIEVSPILTAKLITDLHAKVYEPFFEHMLKKIYEQKNNEKL